MAQAPSLSQARVQSNDDNSKQQQHNHRHLHTHLRASRHPHTGHKTYQHIRLDEQEEQSQPQLQQRDIPEQNLAPRSEVVQIVSVVQVVDQTGAPIGTRTYFPGVAPSVEPNAAVETPAVSALDSTAIVPNVDSSATAAAAASSPSDDASPITKGSDLSTASSLLSSISTLIDSTTATTDPSSTFTSFPTLSGSYNSTIRPSFTNSTSTGVHSLHSNHTLTAFHSNKSSSTFSSSTSSSFSSSSHGSSSTTSPTLSVTGTADGTTGIGAGVGATGGPASTGSPKDSDGSPGVLDPTTTSVIGGVVGGVAGIAIVALVLMMFLKWRRGRGNGIQLLGDGKGPAGRLSLFSNRGGPGDGGGGMTGPSGSTFGIPAALASLTAYKTPSQTQPMIQGSPESSEKGFYRVSGRKLQSVLESGGDGYSDPPSGSRDSRLTTATMSDNRLSGATDNRASGASFWRPDSMAFLSSTENPLQLGSPMRPESGIMVMRGSPARTPMQEQGPVFGNLRSPTPPTPHTDDPLGRSLLALSGSGVSNTSASRFIEERM